MDGIRYAEWLERVGRSRSVSCLDGRALAKPMSRYRGLTCTVAVERIAEGGGDLVEPEIRSGNGFADHDPRA